MKRIAACALALWALAGPAAAGQACVDTLPTPAAVERGLRLAQRTRDRLAAADAEVALVARVGRDLSRHGLRYSHLGFAWRDHPRGAWFVVHELNACGAATSDLHDEGLGNFFLDDLFDHEALLLLPPPATQARLSALLAAGPALALHGRHYNLVAHPFSTRYQNSNQWVLEMLAAALAPDGAVASRAAAQRWLREAGYRPTTIRLGTLERLGARIARANIAFDDHPPEHRFAGRIDTVSVESVADFLAAHAPGTHRLIIRLE
ncbi:MAG: DUF2145 domain-containing protein [Burkholderiales bacterium]|nr:DUF2145 domain-containing protein [Burkholderiales bacterium]